MGSNSHSRNLVRDEYLADEMPGADEYTESDADRIQEVMSATEEMFGSFLPT